MKTKSMKVFLFSLSVLCLSTSAQQASAEPAVSATFQYLAASDFLCPDNCPDISGADNGDTVEIRGKGTLSTNPASVSGGGTFTHKDSAGSVLESGSWTARTLISFVPYDSLAVIGLPNIFGGKAVIRVELSTGLNAILTIDCAIFSPLGHTEGVTLNIQDVINFNKEISGETLFIKQ